MTYWRALVISPLLSYRGVHRFQEESAAAAEKNPGTERGRGGGDEKSLNRQRGTAVSQKQRSSHEKTTWQCYSTQSLPLVFFPSLVAANGGTSHCGEERGNYGETEAVFTHLWKIFHRKPWSAGAFICGGALYGL